MTVASAIFDAAIVKLEALNLKEANDFLFEDNVPATRRHKGFQVRFIEGLADIDSPAINRKTTIARQLEVKVLYRTAKTGHGDKLKSVYRDALDKEEEVIQSFLTGRLTDRVREERLISVDLEPSVIGGDDWLVNTFLFQLKYELTL